MLIIAASVGLSITAYNAHAMIPGDGEGIREEGPPTSTVLVRKTSKKDPFYVDPFIVRGFSPLAFTPDLTNPRDLHKYISSAIAQEAPINIRAVRDNYTPLREIKITTDAERTYYCPYAVVKTEELIPTFDWALYETLYLPAGGD